MPWREARTGDALKDHVRAEYDALAARYERRWARYVRASTEATLARFAVEPGTRVLDVGCGTGLLLARLLQQESCARLAGVDLSPGMARQARARLPAHLPVVVADAEALPFTAGQFDVVVSVSSLHYWPRPEQALLELRRVLRPGGQLAITDWCDDYLTCKIFDHLLRLIDRAHRRIYGSRECRALLSRAGCAVTRLDRYRISWLWGLMTAVGRRATD